MAAAVQCHRRGVVESPCPRRKDAWASACKILANRPSKRCGSVFSIAVVCLHRTPIEHICRAHESNPLSKFTSELHYTTLHTARCALSAHGSQRKDGIAARNGRCVLHGKRGPRRQQAVGRRTIRQQAAARAAQPRRLRALRNDPDALERHGCTATRVVQRLDACDRAAMAYRPTRLRRRPAPSTRRSLRTGQQRRLPFLYRRRR